MKEFKVKDIVKIMEEEIQRQAQKGHGGFAK